MQSTQNPLIGEWFGRAHSGGETKLMGLRFESNESGSTVLFFDLPDLKSHDLGPTPVMKKGDEYMAKAFKFRLLPHTRLVGVWSFDGNDVGFELERGSLPATGQRPVPEGRVAHPLWTFKAGGEIWSSPSVADNVVYFGSNNGIIYALRATTGKLLWQFRTGDSVMAQPTLDGPFLYILSDDGYLYKLDRRSGSLIWRFDTHGGAARKLSNINSSNYDYLTSAATVFGGTVYIGSADKRLYALDAQTGLEKWHFQTQGIVRSTPAVADGQVFIGSYDHNVYAVEANTGELRWKYDALKAVVSSPLVFKGTVYIGSRCSNLFALDSVTGKVKWKYFYWSSWVESSARIRDGVLYIGSSDSQQLFAIDAASGKRIWNFSTNGSNWSTPAVAGNSVYIGTVGVVGYFIDHHGGFFVVDRSTGNLQWHYPMRAIQGSMTYGVASSPVVAQGLVFFGGLDGIFYAFKAQG
jgi:outer membrane protein assembly factor BamB